MIFANKNVHVNEDNLKTMGRCFVDFDISQGKVLNYNRLGALDLNQHIAVQMVGRHNGCLLLLMASSVLYSQ